MSSSSDFSGDLISDENWQSSYNAEISVSNTDAHSSWEKAIEPFISDLEDEDIIVSVDYHM